MRISIVGRCKRNSLNRRNTTSDFEIFQDFMALFRKISYFTGKTFGFEEKWKVISSTRKQ